MGNLPNEIWLIVLEYLAEHEHRYDAWLWRIRLICRSVNDLASSMIWKKLKVIFDVNTERYFWAPPRKTTIEDVVNDAISSTNWPYGNYNGNGTDNSHYGTDDIWQQRHYEYGWGDDGSSRRQYDPVYELEFEQQGLLLRMEELVNTLEYLAKQGNVDGYFNVKNHIAVARAELNYFFWAKDHLSSLLAALILSAEEKISVKTCARAMVRALTETFEGHTEGKYYSNDISSRNINYKIDQLMRYKDVIEELQVVIRPFCYMFESEKSDLYCQLRELLASCPSLKVVKIWGEGASLYPIKITTRQGITAQPKLIISSDLWDNDGTILELNCCPKLRIDSTSIILESPSL
ncbi:hypothetical protein TRVA0_009S00606 [Trichomonascus vanleenenianus]|uniref:uncharacterized protein n=1 Tax=Trichomonascus vanleenenianus TaxID=2268995 RepID=UPI003ECAB62D